MKIQYDKNLKLAGIGIAPWPRGGPKRWFDNYKIASYYDWDIEVESAPEVISLSSHWPQPLADLSTEALVDNHDFRKLVASRLAGYSLFPYKFFNFKQYPDLAQPGVNLIMPKGGKGSLENKAVFRQKFGNLLPIPPFKIVDLTSLGSVGELLDNRDAMVLQHESMSGGRGTFIVRGEEDYQQALAALRAAGGGKTIIVSDYIENAAERSLQGLATRRGVFVGPLQTPLVNSKELLNPDNLNQDKFCGAEISPADRFTGIYDQLRGYCTLIGEELIRLGYRGVFGVDFLVDKTGRAYAIEVNQRITGVTPLLSMLFREGQDIPFELLHLLEIGNFDYDITDSDINHMPPSGAMLVLHSKSRQPAIINDSPRSGIYSADKVAFVEPAYKLNTAGGAGEILLQRYSPVGSKIEAGANLAVVYTKTRILDEQDQINSGTSGLITALNSKISLQKG